MSAKNDILDSIIDENDETADEYDSEDNDVQEQEAIQDK